MRPEDRQRWLDGLGFPLDDFQVAALDALDDGQSVLVAAPTGAGKTVVAEYAVADALVSGGRAFYTTPIKALSNQKFGDLRHRHGSDAVGLLTGDNTVQGEAPAVVMTTEVLRNMLYARSTALDGLRYVVLDEVHFLQDSWRGPVWEEVIIHLPPEVSLVCLSATVSNVDEITDWLRTVRGPTTQVVSHDRPVPLEHLFALGERGGERIHLVPTLVDGRPNPEVRRLEERYARPGRGPRGRPRTDLVTPRRLEIVERLAEDDLLPVLYFIFSRAACTDAARLVTQAGVRLTDADQRTEVGEIVDRHTAGLDARTLAALDHASFRAGLEAGIAPHHAGMVPPFKEAVEECFQRGLVKVIFATETLALGINMPARTVVIEKMSKFTGESREPLKPSDYTQLTGRAGRRGIDDRGYAMALWSRWEPFEQVARLAASREYRLLSAFRPTYNMAANLVRRHDPAEAHRLLSLSLAQFQTDRGVVEVERRIADLDKAIADLAPRAVCERGDVASFVAQAGVERRMRADALQESLGRLRPGSVISLPGRHQGRPGVVIAVGERRNGAVRVTAVTRRGERIHLRPDDFDGPATPLGRIDLPQPYQPTSKTFQREVAKALKRLEHADEVPRQGRASRGSGHPVGACPDVAQHVAAHKEIGRLERRKTSLEGRIESTSASLAHQFERILELLEAWGHLDGWALTEAGELLARTYHEKDLLVAECIRTGVFDDADPPTLAALVSCCTYQHRGSDDPPPPWFPSVEARHRVNDIAHLAHELRVAEDRAGLPLTEEPDPGFMAAAYGWASGGELHHVLADEEMAGGDFVRNVRQLVDLMRQVRDLTPNDRTRKQAAEAVRLLDRDVVAATTRS